jgi:uncharacterized protein YqeY
MQLQERLTEDMNAAMKAGDKQRLSVIRMMLSDVKNRDLMPGKPSAEEVVASYRKKLQKSADEFQKLGKGDEVEKLKQEMAIVDAYLPKKAGADETARLVDEFLAGRNFTEKQLGQAMGAFMKQYGTQVDAAIANQLLRQRLAGK